MVKFDEKFDGHIILYCKGHYRIENVDFITGLRRIWAVRCGIDVEYVSDNFDEYIADKLFTIFKQCNPKKVEFFMDILHKELCDEYRYKDLNAIQRCIMIYRNEISMLKVKEKKNKNYVQLIKLPKSQKRLFRKIVNGKAEFNYYKLVK